MAYTEIYQKRGIKIPSFLGLFSIFLAVFILGRYLFSEGAVPSQGSQTSIKNLILTNRAPTQATVVWQTNEPAAGWVLYGEKESNLSNVATDVRDFASRKKPYTNHFVTLKNLKEDTIYFYKIVSANKIISKGDSDAYEFKTLSKSTQASSLQPAYGKVISANGAPVSGALILLTVEGMHPLSTLSKTSGEWLIPLNYVIDSQTSRPRLIAKTDSLRLVITAEDGKKSTVIATGANINPLPDVALGNTPKNYDFTTPEEVLSAATKTTPPPSIVRPNSFTISFPQNNALIPSSNPLIKGTANPSSTIIVDVTGNKVNIGTKVKADEEGNWRYALGSPLPSGKYVLTASEGTNTSSEITRIFSIGKSGQQVLAEATASSTLTPTATLTPTSIPTSSLSPTPTTALFVTSTAEEVPVSGSSVNIFAIASISLIILGAGLLFLF